MDSQSLLTGVTMTPCLCQVLFTREIRTFREEVKKVYVCSRTGVPESGRILGKEEKDMVVEL